MRRWQPPSLLVSAGPLVPALAVASVLGYGVFVGVGRLLAPAQFVVFAGFWGLVFGLGGVTASLEQEASREAAEQASRGESRGRTVRLLLLAGAAGAVVLVLAVVPVATATVFGHDLRLAALLALAVPGFAAQSVLRGFLLGAGRTGRYAAFIVLEAALRAAALGLLVLLARPGVVACAAAVVVGSFAFLLLGRLPPDPGRPPAQAAFPTVARRTSVLAVAAGCTSAVVTGFPALAVALAPDDVDDHRLGVLLAALSLTRLPLLLLGPVQAILVPAVVQRLASGGWPAARRLVQGVMAAMLVLGAAAAAGAGSVGPFVVRLVYGPDYRLGRWPLAVMTAGATLIVLLLVLASVLVAVRAHGLVTVAWAACLLVVVGLLGVPVGDFLTRVVLSLLLGPAVGVLVAAACLHHATGRLRAQVGAQDGQETA